LMRRVDTIYVATGGGDGEKKKDEKLDGFKTAKHELHMLVKTIREDIKTRDTLQQENPSGTQTIEKSQKIRRDIKKAREHVNTMSVELEQDKKRKMKQKLTESELKIRQEQIDLAYKHIEECEQLEKRRYTQQPAPPSQKKADLFSKSRIKSTPAASTAASSFGGDVPSSSSADYHPATHSDLPPLEVEAQIQQLKERDKKIDEGLEDISKGVGRLKNIAQGIDEELTLQSEMLNVIETKVDAANEQLLTLNRKMKDTLKKVKGADRFIVNFILLMIVLGISAYIYTMVK